jgi:hypothetical protein
MYDAGIEFHRFLKKEDDTVYPIDNSQVKEFHFQKPDGSLIVRNGQYIVDGTDGGIKYITNDTDLDQEGTWRYQVYIERGPVEIHSNIGTFRVLRNLPLE